MKRPSHLLGYVLGFLFVAGPLAAQSGVRFEFGGFGSFIHYDSALLLDNRIGGGGRLALHFNRLLALELEGVYLGPGSVSGKAEYGFHVGSASLLLGGGGRRFSAYVAGGFTRFDVGTIAPYNYAENAFHGGVGFRIGITDQLAIRADGRAIFATDDPITGGSATHVLGTLGLSYFTGAPRPHEPEPEGEPLPALPAPPEAPPGEAAPHPPVPPHTPATPPVRARTPEREEQPAPPPSYPQRTGRGEQIEIGGFGTFTHYDQTFQLKSQVGAGFRLGYFLNDRLSLEVEGAFQSPQQEAPGIESSTLALGTASLVFNFPMGRHSFYLLGGYTRQQWADYPPYEFTDNSVHGGFGVRLFLTRRLALRLEGRALYSWDTNSGTAPWAGHLMGSAGLSYFATPPRQRLAGGVGGRSYLWYWGAQGGAMVYRTNLQPFYYDPLIGGHWMITSKRTSLYFAYEQAFFLTEARAAIFDPSAETTGRVREVSFNDMRRIMFGILAHPAQKVIEPFGGLGFALIQALNPEPDCTVDCETLSKANEAVDRAETAASKAFFWLMVGLQMNYSNRLNVFAHYILTSSSRDFVLMGNSHTIQGGVRYAFGSAKEGLAGPH